MVSLPVCACVRSERAEEKLVFHTVKERGLPAFFCSTFNYRRGFSNIAANSKVRRLGKLPFFSIWLYLPSIHPSTFHLSIHYSSIHLSSIQALILPSIHPFTNLVTHQYIHLFIPTLVHSSIHHQCNIHPSTHPSIIHNHASAHLPNY